MPDALPKRAEPVRPVQATDLPEWDATADVVVVGYGVAGAAAAIGAATQGVDVLVLEHTGGWGGAAALAAWVHLPRRRHPCSAGLRLPRHAGGHAPLPHGRHGARGR